MTTSSKKWTYLLAHVLHILRTSSFHVVFSRGRLRNVQESSEDLEKFEIWNLKFFLVGVAVFVYLNSLINIVLNARNKM